MKPFLDPVRSEIMICAYEALMCGEDSYGREEVTTSALGFAELSTVSAPLWEYATEAFRCLIIVAGQWQKFAETDTPYNAAIMPEEGVRAAHWCADRFARCQLINIYIDRILFAGVCSHLPTYRVEGDLIVVSDQ